MNLLHRIEIAQNYLKHNSLDGWVLYGFHNLNSICNDLLDLPAHLHQSRKFLYLIPKVGTPVKMVHAIEKHLYEQVPGKEIVYKSFEEWEKGLKDLLGDLDTVACDYSPMGEIPTLSKLDAGMFEKIQSFGIKIQSSGEIISEIFGVLTPEEITLHQQAAKKLGHIYSEIPEYISGQFKQGEAVYEKDLQDFILKRMHDQQLQSDDLPICAVGPHTSYPHYQIAGKGKRLEKGLLLLIDMWAKENTPHAVFADMTQMFFLGDQIDPEVENLFQLTLKGQQLAIDTIESLLKEGARIEGAMIDAVVRDFFEREGMGDAIFHRLGHSIENKLHGRGPNLDSLETKDRRPLKKGMLFSIEPGLYIPGKMGIRLEIDALIGEKLEITTGRQIHLPTIKVL